MRDELAAGGAEVRAVTGDVSVEADARAMIRAAIDAYGRLDVLVANAGIIPLGDVLESTPPTGTTSSRSTAAACS